MSTTEATVANGASTNQAASGTRTYLDTNHQGNAGSAKRRTTIVAQSGEWTLGKTIGAGSMGKVKLAKNLETGEQVCPRLYRHNVIEFNSISVRSLSKLYQGNRQTNTITNKIESALINPKRFELLEKQPLLPC